MSFLLQPIRAYEFTSPVYDRITNHLLWLKPISSLIFHNVNLRARFTSRIVNERILELPFVLSALPPLPATLLDVGACESPISLMLASMGYSVTALDTRAYHFTHPNLRSIQSDITRVSALKKYDQVICLSVLEHIGLEVYGNSSQKDLDKQAIKSMYNLLRPGGSLLLTTPVAPIQGFLPGCRVYSLPTLTTYLSQFSRVTIKLGIRDINQNWQIVAKFPKNFKPHSQTPSAVALITAVK